MKRLTKRILAILISAAILAGAGYAFYLSKNQKAAQSKESAPDLSKDQISELETEHEEIKIACIGDSITYGAGVTLTRDKDAYPVKLGKMLGEKYTVFNYGISGKTLMSQTETPYRTTDFFEESQELEPDIVLIMLGTNDSKAYNWIAGEYEKQLEEFVDLYKKLPSSPQVYLMTCCAAFGANENDVVAFHVDRAVIAEEVTPIIRRTAEKCNVPLIDIYSATKDHPEYFADGVHPNAEGNEVIARTVYEALTLDRKEP